MSMETKIYDQIDTLYGDFQSNAEENTDKENVNIEDTLLEQLQPKTFSSIAKEDDILQMYLKDVGKKVLVERLKKVKKRKQKLQNEN